MPTLEELLPKLCKAKIFSTLDAKDGFYHINLDEASSKLTTFWTPFGRYRYVWMPFGTSLAPEEFESTLQEKLADLEGVEVIRDDIIVMGFGETQEQAVRNHNENLLKLLEGACKVNLHLNSRKMELREPEVKFMGHIISKEGLKPDPARVPSERLAQLQKATEQDTVLQTPKTTVLVGWPEQKSQVPTCIPIRDYWNYQEEISLHNGILFKHQHIIILKTFRPEIIARSHSSHLGIEACLRKARDSVFWPGMSSEIKEATSQCLVWSPWSRVAVDMFTLQRKEYVVLVDYYSDFVEVQEVADTTSPTIMQFLRNSSADMESQTFLCLTMDHN